MLNSAIGQSATTISDSALTAIGRQAYDDLLGHLRVRHGSEPDVGISLRLNRCIADMFWTLKTVGRPFELGEDVFKVLSQKHSWDDQRISDLKGAFELYENGALALNDDHVASYLRGHNLPVNLDNVATLTRELPHYYHDAARQAHARLAQRGNMVPLRDEPVMTPQLDFEQLAKFLQSHTDVSAAPSQSTQPCEHSLSETPRVSHLVEKYLDFRRDKVGEDTFNQIRNAANLFIFQNTDLQIGEVKQAHLGSFVELMNRLPTIYGRTREELDGGLAASVARAENMRLSGEGSVGLSVPTINKHVSRLAQLFEFADSNLGLRPVQSINFSKLRQNDQRHKNAIRRNKKRIGWTTRELEQIFSAPVWSGSCGLFDRLTPGSHIWHDGWYFLPLAAFLHGTRSSEFAGLSLGEVHEDAPIPFIELRYTEFRDLKNPASIRDIPIHPEMIRLGFIAYIKALRQLGHKLVFPEMHSPARSVDFDNTFYKQVFQKLRPHCFPNGTQWFKNNGGKKEKDVHSFRDSFTNILLGKVEDSVREDLLGHTGESETRKTYDEGASLELKLDALKYLTPITTHICTKPLNLRPVEWLRYGQPRGRKANVKN